MNGRQHKQRLRYYVGVKAVSHVYEAFGSRTEPTLHEYDGRYLYAIGPFHRKMDAVDFVEHKHYLSSSPIISTAFRACKPLYEDIRDELQTAE